MKAWFVEDVVVELGRLEDEEEIDDDDDVDDVGLAAAQTNQKVYEVL